MLKNMKQPFPRPDSNELELAPSILSADFSNLHKAITTLKKNGCRWVHCDVMDNHFVPNLTFGAPVIKKLTADMPKMFYDVHLMITDPARWIPDYIDAGSNCITFHIEADKDAGRTLRMIKQAGLYAGVSVKPKTPIDALKAVLPLVDMVLVMTVEPGFGGQKLMPGCLSKIRELYLLREKKRLSFVIEVDGGINTETIAPVVAAGGEIIVAGSAVFNNLSVAQNMVALQAAVKSQNKYFRTHFTGRTR